MIGARSTAVALALACYVGGCTQPCRPGTLLITITSDVPLTDVDELSIAVVDHPPDMGPVDQPATTIPVPKGTLHSGAPIELDLTNVYAALHSAELHVQALAAGTPRAQGIGTVTFSGQCTVWKILLHSAALEARDGTFTGQLTLDANPSTPIVADGTDSITLTATVTDSTGEPVSGQQLVLTVTGDSNSFDPVAPVGPTDAEGRFTVALKSTKAETKTVTAQIQSVTDRAIIAQRTTSVVFTHGPRSEAASSIVATPGAAPADCNTGSAIAVTVTVADDFGNPITGQDVTVKTLFVGQTIQDPGPHDFTAPAGAQKTDEKGQGNVSIKSSVEGPRIIRACLSAPCDQESDFLATFSSAVFTLVTPRFSSDDVALHVGASPFSVTSGDFNGDGVLDLATADSGADQVSVLLGNKVDGKGDGTFAAAANFAIGGSSPCSVTVGDFNGDGVSDLATANLNSDTVSVLLGNDLNGKWDGTFAAPLILHLNASSFPLAITEGDFNGDGVLDLATANSNLNTVSILLGNNANGKGDGTFLTAGNFATGANPCSVLARDFNGDGVLDLATANRAANTVSVLLGNNLSGKGDGTFATAHDFVVGTAPFSVTVGDFNGDGVSDLATADSGAPGEISVLLGNNVSGKGDGTFATAANFATGESNSVTVGDFNGDGVLDLATATTAGISVLLGNNVDGQGDGTFPSVTPILLASTDPISVTVGDFDGDGLLDLVTANYSGDDISVLLNTTVVQCQ